MGDRRKAGARRPMGAARSRKRWQHERDGTIHLLFRAGRQATRMAPEAGSDRVERSPRGRRRTGAGQCRDGEDRANLPVVGRASPNWPNAKEAPGSGSGRIVPRCRWPTTGRVARTRPGAGVLYALRRDQANSRRFLRRGETREQWRIVRELQTLPWVGGKNRGATRRKGLRTSISIASGGGVL